MFAPRAMLLAAVLGGCGAKSGLSDGIAIGLVDAGTDAALDGQVPPPPDAGVLACDGLPLPRPGSVTEWPTTARSQGLAVTIPDPPGLLVVGGLRSDGLPADRMLFLDLRLGVTQPLPVEGDRVNLPFGAGAAIYVPRGDFVVVLGGSIAWNGAPTDQAFSFYGQGEPDLRSVVASRLPTLPDGPARNLGAIYDPVANRIILHGGVQEGGDRPVHRRTRALDLDRDAPVWELVLPEEQGPAAGVRAMGYDPAGHRAIEITDDEDGEGLAVYALTLTEGLEEWQRLGPIEFSPSVTGELVWDDRACGFHLLSARHTRCVLEHWILTVEGPQIATIFRGDLNLDPAPFFGAALFWPSRSSLFVHSAEDCALPGTNVPMAATHEVTLVR